MSLEGQIIEFLDADQLRLVYVRKQEHEKLQVVDPKGRNLSVSDERVAIVHRAVSESDFPSRAREIAERVAARQTEVDIELLWQSLGGNQRELFSADLAQMFFAEATPEASSAVFRALLEDNLFFKRKGIQFVPRTEDQVEVEKTRRQRQKEREGIREHAGGVIAQLMKKGTLEITTEMKPVIDRVQNWLRLRNGDEVGTLLEDIAGATKARDAAYGILLRAGRVDPGVDRFLIMAGVDTHFPPAVLDAAEQIPRFVHHPGRVDYRHLPAFTIDDEDTAEVDDALTLERRGDEIIVGIHIADVSAFVTKGELLDGEAARRSSTIYLPSATVRMFPDRLATDLASLVANSPRPCFTVEVRFDERGNRLGYRIVLATIQVERRLSYDEADQELQTGHRDLETLRGIATALQSARAERGAITFRRPELKVRVKGGEIEIAKINPNSPSRFIVSEMMILANGLAADFASMNNVPVIFRTQEPREALAIEDAPAIEALAFERLRKTFKRSRLSLAPGGHSGLGLTAYTQASSPIRRYADLVTQRQFTAVLSGKALPYAREELLQILANSEAAEQDIRAIEDKSTTYWLLEHLSREIASQPLNAIVLDKKGTVELEDYYLRGKVPATAQIELGATVHVRIESIDPVRGDVRFRLA